MSAPPPSAPPTAADDHTTRRVPSGGPDPSAAVAADRGADQSDGAGASPAAAIAILHRHALESIFAFLSQRELAFALRVSRGWLAAVRTMRRLELHIERLPSAPLAECAQSAMGRHVIALGGDFNRRLLDTDTLSILADRMAHLRELSCGLDLPPPNQPLTFPAALRHLDVFWRRGELSDAQVDELRALPQLQCIDVVMTAQSLRRVLRHPHDLQWQQIFLPDPFDDESAALLPQLPSLTKILCWATVSQFDWPRGLPSCSLTDVYLSFTGPMGAAGRAESLVVNLQCCSNIEILSLCHQLTAAQLTELLPQLPRLRELRLSCLSIASLAFLAQPPMTSQLSCLKLFECPRLPLSDLRHVHTLRGLIKLELKNSFTAPLDEHSLSLLTPPSLLLPQLKEFTFRHR